VGTFSVSHRRAFENPLAVQTSIFGKRDFHLDTTKTLLANDCSMVTLAQLQNGGFGPTPALGLSLTRHKFTEVPGQDLAYRPLTPALKSS
jgi:hypothetical protein